MSIRKRILLVSNGHGEDTESSYIAQALLRAGLPVDMAAVAIVGEGNAYERVGVPLVGPTFNAPSNGFNYMDRSLLLDDIRAGLIGATVRQFRAVRRHAAGCDIVLATGDEFCQLFAYASGKPFISFIAPLSANYEGSLRLDLILRWIMRSPRCLSVVTKDKLTAADLSSRGYRQVEFGGNPSVDFLEPKGKELALEPDATVIGLLPGSRPPEAADNLLLQMRFVKEIARRLAATGDPRKLLFRAALVPALMEAAPRLAAQAGWRMDPAGHFMRFEESGLKAEIGIHSDAFADILHAAKLVVAMAGQASDQALALGKPSFMFAGGGPQFNWRFAEAQYRLHGGLSVLMGDGPADDALLRQAAASLVELLDADAYFARVAKLGPERVGSRGSAARFVRIVARHLGLEPSAGRIFGAHAPVRA